MTLEIENFRFGKIEISGNGYTKDLIVFPNHISTNWRREQGHTLSLSDLQEVLDADPDVLIIGQGSLKRMKIPPYVQNQVEAQGIEIIAQATDEACQTYNRLRHEKRVVAALHLTC